MRYAAMIIAVLPALLLAAPAPAFDPLRFFAGRTRGEAQLKIILRARRPVSVQGNGRINPDGSLTLDQIVVEGDKAPRARRWRLRQVAPGRYAGTLTDARGPVAGEVAGRRLTLRFTSNDGFRIRQTLVLQPDGRTLANRLEAKKFGITVAVLTERITKIGE